ncbi:integral membrane protein [Pseudomonas sp. 21]|uniref:integral membrane protein n=1 Tax=unclassified Pseudomonas TaxID=196821 RepID=UPI0005EBA975|nr:MULTISPECIES: integral membrane protein [unclassified Pseudomonas]KJK01128.1 integral membrane protein [Pseudomonas sp. 21]MBV7582037.1 DUF975 family protein [Pseudomonas sp. PDM33]
MQDTAAQNPYSVPQSNLEPHVAQGAVPSIGEALNRGYNFSLNDLLGESWRRTKGTKGLILGGFIVFYAAIFALVNVLSLFLTVVGVAGIAGMGLLSGAEPDGGMAVGAIIAFILASLVLSFAATALCYPLLAGVNMLGIRRAADQPLRFNEVFSHFGRTFQVVVCVLLSSVLICIGYFLFVLPGIYLSVAYMLAIPLVVERGLSPWAALEASRKAISQHWFKVFGLLLVFGLLFMLSTLTFGIALIWVMPWLIVAIGVLYRTIFGVLPVNA